MGLEPVVSLGHLAHLTGAPYPYLRAVVSRRKDPYISISRRKSNGAVREISSPEPMLADVQRWILKRVLPSLYVHPASYAYQRNRSIKQCAGRHVGASWLVKMDLHDFFHAIDERQVFKLLRAAGYPALISFEMARLCTRSFAERPCRGNNPKYRQIPEYNFDRAGVLPQGGPTSGALANAAAASLDRRLAELARSRDVVYTRYSDDLTFSARREFSRKSASSLIKAVNAGVIEEGFEPHHKKTRVITPGARHVVLGLLLGDDSVRLLPEFKRRVEVHVRGVEKFGLVGHTSHRGFNSLHGFVNHVDGCLAFATGIEPVYAQTMRTRWQLALNSEGYL